VPFKGTGANSPKIWGVSKLRFTENFRLPPSCVTSVKKRFTGSERFRGCARHPLLAVVGIVSGYGLHNTLIQLLAQSAPMAGGRGVKVGSGVCVGGSGVEVESPAGTVSVGTGVSVIVAVGGIVQVGCTGMVGCGVSERGIKLGASNVIMVTQTVPMTPISAAMMAGSILLLFVDIGFPSGGFF
jgi:hypothetical protein